METVTPPPEVETKETPAGQGRRLELVTSKELAKAVKLSPFTIKSYSTLPGCPLIKLGYRTHRYVLADYIEWLKNDGPAEGRRIMRQQLLEKHGE